MILHDSLRGDEGRGPLWQALLALLMMSLSPGMAFTLGRIRQSLEKAGLQVTEVVDLAPEPGCLVVATRKA